MALPELFLLFCPFSPPFFFHQAHQVTFNYPSGPVLSCLPGLGVLFFFLKILVTLSTWISPQYPKLILFAQSFTVTMFPGKKPEAAEGVEAESHKGCRDREQPRGLSLHSPPSAFLLKGPPSIHCPNQKGLNPPVPSESVLGVLLGVLPYNCLSHLIYYTAIFRNISVHIFHPFDEIHIFFTLFSSTDFMYQGNPCLVVEWMYKWHLHPYALPLVLLIDPFKGYNPVILHILLREGPRDI